MSVPSTDDLLRQVDEWEASVQQKAAQACDQAAQFSALRGVGDTGQARADVDSGGRLLGLTLTERTQSWSAAKTAAEVLAAVRLAQADVSRRAQEWADQQPGALAQSLVASTTALVGTGHETAGLAGAGQNTTADDGARTRRAESRWNDDDSP